MIQVFRKIRYQLMSDNKTTRYFKYAIGEIALVMIGILLALQVNNWNEHRKELQLEKRFLSELILDLQSDSLTIAYMKNVSNIQLKAKQKLTDYFNQKTTYPNDSLSKFFNRQWRSLYSFNPITTTLDEMKSTGNIGVIKNLKLRRKILKVYNEYLLFKNYDERIYHTQQDETWKLLFSKVPNLYSAESFQDNKTNIIEALSNFEIRNRILGNYVRGINHGLHQLEKTNSELLMALRKEINE